MPLEATSTSGLCSFTKNNKSFVLLQLGFYFLNPCGLLSNAIHITSFIYSPKTINLLAVPKCLLLDEFPFPKSISQPYWNDSKKPLNSRSFLNIWPQIPFSSMSKLILHFLWTTCLPTSPRAQFCPSSSAPLALGLLPTPWFKCFPKSCLWPPSLFLYPLSPGKLFQSSVSSNHLKTKDSPVYIYGTLIL